MESGRNLGENGNLPEVSVEDEGMKCPEVSLRESFQTQAPSNETSESFSDPSASSPENQKFGEFLDVADSEDEDSFRSGSEGDAPVWDSYDEEVVTSEYAQLKEVLYEMMLGIGAEIPIGHGKYLQNSGVPNDHNLDKLYFSLVVHTQWFNDSTRNPPMIQASWFMFQHDFLARLVVFEDLIFLGDSWRKGQYIFTPEFSSHEKFLLTVLDA